MHFYFFKSVARSIMLPPSGLLILAVIGATLLLFHHRRSGLACVFTGLVLLVLLSVPLVANMLTRWVEVYPAFDPSHPSEAQAIVILGGALDRIHAPEYGGEPAAELELLERLDYGAWLARLTHLPILVTSDPRNARAMAAVLSRDFQMPPRWVDWDAHDTFENARNSAAILKAQGVHSILLVTSTTHMLRSLREFKAAGLDVTAAPSQLLATREDGIFLFMPSAEGMQRSNRAIYELLGEQVREIFVALHLRQQQPG